MIENRTWKIRGPETVAESPTRQQGQHLPRKGGCLCRGSQGTSSEARPLPPGGTSSSVARRQVAAPRGAGHRSCALDMPSALQARQTTQPTSPRPCQHAEPRWLPSAPSREQAPQDACSWVTKVVHAPWHHQHPWETATLESTWSPHCSRDPVESTSDTQCGTALLLSCRPVTHLTRLVTLMTWTTHRGVHLGPACGPWFLFIPSSLSKHLETITTL